MGRVAMSPQDYQEVLGFLNDTCPVRIEGFDYVRGPSGLSMKVQYRDERGNTQKKTLSTPDDYSGAMVDLAVMLSEWLSHGSTRASDIAKVN